MNDCLDDIQIEEALGGPADGPAVAHLSRCPGCRQRLLAAQSIRAQLRAAFAPAHVSPAALDRIRQITIANDADRPVSSEQPEPLKVHSHRATWLLHHWGRYAVAASMILGVSLVILWQWREPSSASAAQELVKLHEQNLAGRADMGMRQSSEQEEAYLSNRLGYKVAVPRDKGELRVKCCCIAKFLGRQAGNLVIQGPHGPISVIVSDVNERELTTKTKIVRNGRSFWVCQIKCFYTVSVRDGGLVYCAVGDEAPESLITVLDDMLQQRSK